MKLPRVRILPLVAVAAPAALLAALGGACSSGQTADCDDAQCGVVPEASLLEASGDDSGDDGSDAPQSLPEAGPDGSGDAGGSDSSDSSDVSDSHDEGSHDAGDSGSKDAAEGG
jgi:hypothetical protein